LRWKVVREGEERMGCGWGRKLRAARRMKGVVRPQARPTRRKARVCVSGEVCVEGGLWVWGMAVGVGRDMLLVVVVVVVVVAGKRGKVVQFC